MSTCACTHQEKKAMWESGKRTGLTKGIAWYACSAAVPLDRRHQIADES